LAAALEQARAVAAASGRQLALVGSVCGTAGDPQELVRQEAVLRAAGVLLAESNAEAVRLAAAVAAHQARGAER
jgi:FdrA protein